MNRLFVLSLITAIAIAIDVYAFQGIKVLTANLNPGLRKVLHIAYWSVTIFGVLLAAGIGTGVLERIGGISRAITMGLFMTFFLTKLIFVLFVAVDDIIRLARYVVQIVANLSNSKPIGEGPAISRLQFLMKAGAAVAAVPLAGMTWGVLNGAHDYRVRKLSVKLDKLPDAFRGLKIVQISDVHSGSFYNKAAVERGIDLLMQQKPDVVFFTGDLVNNTASEMENYKELFGRIKAPMGVYSTLGNHDYGDYVQWESREAKQENLNQLMAIHREMGWDLLMNEHRFLEKDGEKIAVIGIENWGAKGRFPKYGKMEQAYRGTEHAPVKLLLSHDPSHWDAQVRTSYPDIDIMFAGHTHGMQFGIESSILKWSPVKYMYEQWAGLYTNGQQHLYVNRGFGFIGFPGRVGIWPEITLMELI